MASAIEADAPARLCPRCDNQAVVFDYLQGLSVCENCGGVLKDEDLVSHLEFTGTNRPMGVFVAAGDTGAGASAQMMHGTAVGRAVQRSRPSEPMVILRQHLRLLTDKLALPPGVYEEAELYLQRLHDAVTWNREMLAAAAAYLAIRQNALPITLIDLAHATHVDMYALGRYYHQALQVLDVRPPLMKAADLLPRAVDRVLQGNVSPEVVAQVKTDSLLVAEWMEQHLVGRRHPIVSAGAALCIACEMNNVSAGVDHVAAVLRIGGVALGIKLARVREKLLSFAYLLPYGAKMSSKSVGSHMRTIIRMVNILGKEEAAALPSEALPEATEPAARPAQGIDAATPAEPVSVDGAGKKARKGDNENEDDDDPAEESGKKRRRVRFSDDQPSVSGSIISAIQRKPAEEAVFEDCDISDNELDEYLRTDEEVELLEKLYDER